MGRSLGSIYKPAGRAACVGHGWHPTAMAPERLRYLAEQAQADGRQAADIPVSISLPMYSARAGRYPLGLDPAEMVQDIRHSRA